MRRKYTVVSLKATSVYMCTTIPTAVHSFTTNWQNGKLVKDKDKKVSTLATVLKFELILSLWSTIFMYLMKQSACVGNKYDSFYT